MQSYTEIPASETLRNSRQKLLDNDKTAISCNAGTAFPATNLQVGMLCFRTDLNKLYQLSTDGKTWIELFNLSDNKGLVSRATTADNALKAATADNALKANGYTVNSNVPVNAKFTDTTYGAVTDSAAGLMTAAQKKKLDGLFNYSLPVASATTLGGVKVGHGLTISNGVLSSSVTGGNATHGEQLFTANGTFVVPEGVSLLVVTAVGGGGGGGGGCSGTRGGSGYLGTAGKTYECTVFVSSGTNFRVRVGQGGKGGSTSGSGGAGGYCELGSGSAGGSGRYAGGGGGGGGASGIDSRILAGGGSGGTGGVYQSSAGAGGAGGAGAGSSSLRSGFVSSSYGAPGAAGIGGSGSNGNATSGGAGGAGCVHIRW